MTQYTPNLNLPYPEAGDAPRGNEQIQALATALDGQAAPEFKPGLLTTVETNINDGTQWTYALGQVHLMGLFGSLAAFNTNQVTVGTLPAALDPVAGTARWSVAMTGVGNNLALGRLTISTALVVSLDLAPGTTWGNASSIYVSGVSWFVSDPAAALAYFNAADPNP